MGPSLVLPVFSKDHRRAMGKEIVVKFEGFESLYDFEKRLTTALVKHEEELFPEREWEGTLKVTLEYEE